MKLPCKESKRLTLAVFLVLRAAIIFCLFRQLLRANYQNMLLCILSLVIMSVPAFLHTKLRLRLPGVLEIRPCLKNVKPPGRPFSAMRR